MTEPINLGRLYPNVMPPGGVSSKRPHAGGTLPGNVQGKSFQDVFHEQALRISQHAEQRLKQRGITLQSEQLKKIETAVDKAAAKGAKDSLVLMKDLALIVNVKNRTVITAMDGASLKDNVFTNIDSAVIVE